MLIGGEVHFVLDLGTGGGAGEVRGEGEGDGSPVDGAGELVYEGASGSTFVASERCAMCVCAHFGWQ